MLYPATLKQRCRQPEIQDQLELETGCLHHALQGLERINRWSGSVRILWPAILQRLRHHPSRPLRVLDIATGAGDVPIGLWHRARRAGLRLQIDGCDFNPRTVQYARELAQTRDAEVQFFDLDAIAEPIPDGYDLIISSLFLHHLQEEDAADLLRRMAWAANQMVLVNDLRRSPFGFLLARVGTRLLSRCKVIHYDGPISVESAFTVEEARALAGAAGLTDATVEPRWPWRWLLTWTKA